MSPPRATLEQKIQALDWYYHHGTKSQQYTVKYFQNLGHFSITKSSFNRWLKEEQQLRASFRGISVDNRANYKTRPRYKKFEVDKCLERWFEERLFANDSVVSERELIDQWALFDHLIGGDAGQGERKSNGWVYHFKKKHSKRKEIIGNWLDMISTMTIEDEIQRIRRKLDGVSLEDIYQFDEFALTTRITSGESESLKCIVGLMINGDGSDWVDPLIIGKAEVQGMENYYQSGVGLTNDVIIQYLTRWDRSLERKVVLLLDCLYEHVFDTSCLKNIRLVFFNPTRQTKYSLVNCDEQVRDTLEELQPLNLGIIRNFKLLYKYTILQHYLNSFLTLHKIEKMTNPVQMYQIIMDVFHEMKTNSGGIVLQCWENSGILPRTSTSPTIKRQYINKTLESNFFQILQKFEQHGILKVNTVNLDQLLFPLDEAVINKFHSDLEIVAMVKLEAKTNEQSVEPSSQIIPLDPQERQHVEKFVNVDLKKFFTKNSMHFPKSSIQFQKFLNTFINESMTLQLDQTSSNNYGDENILPDLLNR